MPAFHTDLVWLNIIIFIIGLLALIKGSDLFVDGAVAFAKRLNVPHIVIGLTLVSIGTSLPELATDVYASFRAIGGSNTAGEIIAGDIIGSNITNIALVLGVGTIIMGSIKTPRQLLLRDVVFMLCVFLLLPIAAITSGGAGELSIGRVWGVVLLVILASYLYFLFRHPEKIDEMEEEDAEVSRIKSMPGVWIALIVGMILIFSGAKALVDNVLAVALQLGLNTALVSATVVALGTSLPELAVTITGAIKKQHSLALGNIIGSCTFNVLLIIGVCSAINPVPISQDMLYFNIPIMLACGVLLAFFMRTKWKLERLEGAVLLIAYIIFCVCNILKIKS
jgi:cation:H+ antiporter